MFDERLLISGFNAVLSTLFLFENTNATTCENTEDMFIWRVWREYIGHVYMKSLKRIHITCLYEKLEENA